MAGSGGGNVRRTAIDIEALSDLMISTDRTKKPRLPFANSLHQTVIAVGIASTFVSLIMLTTSPALAANPACPANKFIAEIGRDLFSAARSGTQKSFKSVIVRYADSPQIGQYALGHYRNALPEEDAPDYIDMVVDYIARLMAENAVQFQGNRFEVTRCPKKGKLVGVISNLHSELHGVRPVIWRLIKSENGYRVLDVNVHGVWLGVQLRAKFTSVLKRSKGDINRLYTYLAPERKELQPVNEQ